MLTYCLLFLQARMVKVTERVLDTYYARIYIAKVRMELMKEEFISISYFVFESCLCWCLVTEHFPHAAWR